MMVGHNDGFSLNPYLPSRTKPAEKKNFFLPPSISNESFSFIFLSLLLQPHTHVKWPKSWFFGIKGFAANRCDIHFSFSFLLYPQISAKCISSSSLSSSAPVPSSWDKYNFIRRCLNSCLIQYVNFPLAGRRRVPLRLPLPLLPLRPD